MITWTLAREHVTIKVKRAPWLAGVHRMAGGFLYLGPSTPPPASADTPAGYTETGHEVAIFTPRSARANNTSQRKDTSLKTAADVPQAVKWREPRGEHQLGAAGGEPRRGVWLPAAQGTLYSYKGQGFLPGRTGLNPLRRNTLGDQGLREIGLTALPPPAGT